ncbi:hypothetical protein F441_01928 [Phytophthora nicotianae CJ01A1]|uniref:FLYWCH-type domain-containing protein n=2 Tax=Phytophthora nicotianae TaxID=4792 RepID=W2XR56_PHYNI|nr:hypothetical protein L917_01798 [Phytophthora nicotianae]ETP25166.1 hypothetical protein F441_01928 [Phytophthora nicotianae CJ01A1]
MQHDDHYYYYKDSYKTTKYYACRQSQTTKCKARQTCRDDGTVHIKGDHVCVTGDDVIARDVQEEMRQLLELQSLGNLRVLPGRVWRDVKDEMIRTKL